MSEEPQNGWNIDKSAQTYQIRGWGEPYFQVGDNGHVHVRPDPRRDNTIDLYALANDLKERGLQLPLLLRFSNILEDRIRLINECFGKAIEEYEYGGRYQGVYPVKVNPQRHVVEEIVKYGAPWNFGLEAGSKPELLIALANLEGPEQLIICNGYKDDSYIETALLAQQFSKTVVLVLERAEELELILRAAERTGARPVLGVRAKLSAKGTGQWADSAGERAKFGLSAAEIVDVVDRLAERGMSDCLQLVHFHIGSQISSIIPIKNALREAARFYVELAKMGAGMKYIDVGGGLAVDYDGSKTDFHASKNYEVQEYAYDVVAAIKDACERFDCPPPTIVSESGRAVAAYQAVLIYDVVGTNESARINDPLEPSKESHSIIHELYETYRGVVPKNVQEAWHDASTARDEAQSLFRFGYLSLRERGQAERLFHACGKRILEASRRLRFVPEEIQEVEQTMGQIYYCNFSVFQSAPDTWAIDQLFPIVPLHRLDEEPTIRARLADLTCDSDGMIDHFIDVEEPRNVLDVHELKDDEPYLMGMFLVGAYQEILGDLHNLFGDANTVHVHLASHGYDIAHVIKGDTVREVLHYVQYDSEKLVERVRRQAEHALSQGQINLRQMKLLMDHYEESLRNYTYLTDES